MKAQKIEEVFNIMQNKQNKNQNTEEEETKNYKKNNTPKKLEIKRFFLGKPHASKGEDFIKVQDQEEEELAEVLKTSVGPEYTDNDRLFGSFDRAEYKSCNDIGMSASLCGAARKGASLLERVKRSRLGFRNYHDSGPKSQIQLVKEKFNSPRIVKPLNKCMIKGEEKHRRNQNVSVTFQHKTTRVSLSPDTQIKQIGNTDLSKVKEEEVRRIFGVHQLHRKIGSDLLLDNYRRRAQQY